MRCILADPFRLTRCDNQRGCDLSAQHGKNTRSQHNAIVKVHSSVRDRNLANTFPDPLLPPFPKKTSYVPLEARLCWVFDSLLELNAAVESTKQTHFLQSSTSFKMLLLLKAKKAIRGRCNMQSKSDMKEIPVAPLHSGQVTCKFVRYHFIAIIVLNPHSDWTSVYCIT